MTTLRSRLEAENIRLDDEMDIRPDILERFCEYEEGPQGARILIEGLHSAVFQNEGFPGDRDIRLDAKSSFAADEDVSYPDLSEDLRITVATTHRTFLRALMMGANLISDLDKIQSCRRFRIYASTAPGFRNIGLLSNSLRRSCETYFPDAPPPRASAIGVTSLPLNATVLIDCQFDVSI